MIPVLVLDALFDVLRMSRRDYLGLPLSAAKYAGRDASSTSLFFLPTQKNDLDESAIVGVFESWKKAASGNGSGSGRR